MITEMTITETRKKITSLENKMGYDDTISITNHGKEVFALMKWDTYESIEETLEILADEKMLSNLKKGIAQVKDNGLVDFEDFKKSLECTK
jgi:prevent-host-death family protein